MRIAIVGAGPAGLAVAGRLKKDGISFDLYDQAESIGDSWKKHYDRLRLHTVNKLSHLPNLPFPDSFPKYVSRDEFINYQKEYCKYFDIRPILGRRIKSISRVEDC